MTTESESSTWSDHKPLIVTLCIFAGMFLALVSWDFAVRRRNRRVAPPTERRPRDFAGAVADPACQRGRTLCRTQESYSLNSLGTIQTDSPPEGSHSKALGIDPYAHNDLQANEAQAVFPEHELAMPSTVELITMVAAQPDVPRAKYPDTPTGVPAGAAASSTTSVSTQGADTVSFSNWVAPWGLIQASSTPRASSFLESEAQHGNGDVTGDINDNGYTQL